MLYSDQVCRYRWPDWIRMEDAKLIRSMSKKGCSPDNAACDGFFGRMKLEMFYVCSWAGGEPARVYEAGWRIPALAAGG